MKLVLGSESIFRRHLLDQAGFEFEIIPPRIDEKAVRDANPSQLVLKLGIAKSEAVVRKVGSKTNFFTYADAVIVTSDQVAVRESDGTILEKPLTAGGLPDVETAMQYLRSYTSSRLIFHTSLVCCRMTTQVRISQVVTNEVELRPFTESEIAQLVSIGSTYKACGAFPSGLPNDPAGAIIDRHILSITGDPTAMIGLPMQALKQCLRAFGYEVPRALPTPAVPGESVAAI